MAISYQYDASGYFVGQIEDFGGPLPNNATYTPPKEQNGHIPCWTGQKWIQIENHRGEEGYVHGTAHTITEYGPLPEGWSDTPPPPTRDELFMTFISAIQAHLDSFARTRNYDGIMSATTYATSTLPRFQAEGRYAIEARDMTWTAGYAVMDDVLAGKRPMPTINEVLAELPPLVWPE